MTEELLEFKTMIAEILKKLFIENSRDEAGKMSQKKLLQWENKIKYKRYQVLIQETKHLINESYQNREQSK